MYLIKYINHYDYDYDYDFDEHLNLRKHCMFDII